MYTVQGHVQGVWFRDSTRREAERLGISGYARNLSNGDVEVLGCGSCKALDDLGDWLHDGPPMARVSKVIQQSVADQFRQGFEIG